MELRRLNKLKALALRISLGLTVLLWGYEKLTLEKLAQSYSTDYQQFMFIDVNTFLGLAGWLQVIMGIMLFSGLLTRINALALALMGIVTIAVPGMIVLKDIPHFAYAFALTGAALASFVEGGGYYSLDGHFTRWSMKLVPKTQEYQGQPLSTQS